MLLTIEFLAVPAHIDTYQFGDSANHESPIQYAVFFVELADKLYNP